MFIKMKKGFTLAEVLITLGIIGVVAALTIPTLISNNREKVYVTRLKATYSIFSEALKQASAEDGNPSTWDLGGTATTESANKLYDHLKPYLKMAGECDSGKNKKYCFYDGVYKSLFDTDFIQQPKTNYGYSRQGQLQNGVAFVFWTRGSCEDDTSCGALYVDINGEEPPNKAGVDYFNFNIMGTGWIRPGEPLDDWICKYNDKSQYNGTKCTKWVLKKGNMDYRRRDISSEWNF